MGRLEEANVGDKDLDKAVANMGADVKGEFKRGGLIENIIPGGGGQAARSAFNGGTRDKAKEADWPGNQKLP